MKRRRKKDLPSKHCPICLSQCNQKKDQLLGVGDFDKFAATAAEAQQGPTMSDLIMTSLAKEVQEEGVESALYQREEKHFEELALGVFGDIMVRFGSSFSIPYCIFTMGTFKERLIHLHSAWWNGRVFQKLTKIQNTKIKYKNVKGNILFQSKRKKYWFKKIVKLRQPFKTFIKICHPSHQNRPVVARCKNWVFIIYMMKSYLLTLKWCPICENLIQNRDFTQLWWSKFLSIFFIFSQLLSLLSRKWPLPTTGLFGYDGSHMVQPMQNGMRSIFHFLMLFPKAILVEHKQRRYPPFYKHSKKAANHVLFSY